MPPFLWFQLVLAKLEPQPRYIEDIRERVVGGEVAKANSWPWQVMPQVIITIMSALVSAENEIMLSDFAI